MELNSKALFPINHNYQWFSLTESQICMIFTPKNKFQIARSRKLFGVRRGILQVSGLDVETLKNEVFLTKKAVKSWIKRLVTNFSKTHIF